MFIFFVDRLEKNCGIVAVVLLTTFGSKPKSFAVLMPILLSPLCLKNYLLHHRIVLWLSISAAEGGVESRPSLLMIKRTDGKI